METRIYRMSLTSLNSLRSIPRQSVSEVSHTFRCETETETLFVAIYRPLKKWAAMPAKPATPEKRFGRAQKRALRLEGMQSVCQYMISESDLRKLTGRTP